MYLRYVALACCVMSLPAYAGDAQRLFDANCAACHRSLSVFSNIPTETLKSELAAPQVRKHRFVLTPDEQQLLLQYLTAGNTGTPK